jgi:hypothetical protein
MSVARYQSYNPAPVWMDLAGIANIPGGSIQFYEIGGTTTPKATYSAFSGGVANSNPVLLDSSGRANTEVWLDGDYTVVVRNADSVAVDTFDMRSPTDNAAVVPVPGDDEYLGGDGVDFIPKTYRGLPDPTGLVGYFPLSDGEGYVMTLLPDAPVIPDPEIVITTTPNKSVQIGVSDDTTKFLTQYGSDSVGPSGTKTVTDSVVFPTAFSAAPWFVDVVPTSGQAATDGAYVTWHVTSISTTGFTVTFNIPDDDSRPEWQIGNTINYIWKAEGTVVVA